MEKLTSKKCVRNDIRVVIGVIGPVGEGAGRQINRSEAEVLLLAILVKRLPGFDAGLRRGRHRGWRSNLFVLI